MVKQELKTKHRQWSPLCEITATPRRKSAYREDTARRTHDDRDSNSDREDQTMRVLEQQEVEMVSGGSPTAVTGAAGAFVGGVGSGIGYLLESSNPTLSGFFGSVAVGTVSGALLGSGVKLVAMAFSGTRGVAVPGVSAIGLGFSIEAARGAADRGRGGSD